MTTARKNEHRVLITYNDPTHNIPRRQQLGRFIGERLEARNLGYSDGGATGMGVCEMFFYGADGDAIWAEMESYVREMLSDTSVQVMIRYGEVDDKNAAERDFTL